MPHGGQFTVVVRTAVKNRMDWWLVLTQCFSARGDFAPGGHFAMSEGIFGFTAREGVRNATALVSRGQGCL